MNRIEQRLATGEAYMICHDCGARLYSFDGSEDRTRGCMYEVVDWSGRKKCDPCDLKFKQKR